MAISNEIEKLERRWQQTSGLVFAPLAEAYRKAGLHQRALEVLEQGLALHPEYGPALIVRGRCHLDSGKLDQAEQAFEQALTRDPMDPIANRGIADVFARTNRVTQAVERLQLLVDLDPRNNEARAALDRLLQYVVPEPAIVADVAAPSAEPIPAPVATAPAAVVAEPAPAPEPPVIEPISLEPEELPPAEPAPLIIEPTSLVPEEPVAPPPDPEPSEFRIESFAVEPLEVPAELRSEPPAEPFGPISWTPAPIEEMPTEPPVSVTSEPEPELNGPVHFEPAEPVSEMVPEAAVESVPEVESEPVVESGSEVAASEVASESVAESASEAVSEAGAESVSGEAIEEPVAADPVEPEPVTESMADHAPELIETHAVAPEPIPAESEPEVVAEAAVAEYASAMPPTNELVSPVVEEAGLSPEPEAVAAEAPALIVTESMAELFLKQGHKELALAVYRQLTVRGPVSEQLSENMQQVEAELAGRGVASEHRRDYAARVTGGRSVESLLQGILKAEPPAPPSSVLPPAIEHATGEPSRQGPDTLPLSAVFGDEPVVAPRPESIASDPEPSFDEFFGAVPSPEPAPAGGERSAEAEDLRQFNEWLKGLKR